MANPLPICQLHFLHVLALMSSILVANIAFFEHARGFLAADYNPYNYDLVLQTG